jgi:gamma-glutamyltranspeptidase/glutathione hydrolase
MDPHAPYPTRRSALYAGHVVATSQPLAAQAGLQMLWRGGNAVDAALASAIALTVVEPTSNGIGGDLFAIVWDGQALHGLNASGRSPRAWTPERFAGHTAMPERGWESVTVPGAVSGWVALHERFGRLPFETLFEPAIAYAEQGFLVGPITARAWSASKRVLAGLPDWHRDFTRSGRVPGAGERWQFPEQGATLRQIAESRGETFYRGRLADAMVAHARAGGGGLSADDLREHRADWVGTIATPYAGAELHEIPPNGQGIATLMALGILRHVPGFADLPVDSVPWLHLQIEAMKLAMADAARWVADASSMTEVRPQDLIDDAYLAARAKLIDPRRAGDPGHGAPGGSGTVYLAAADGHGGMVSLIQSNYAGFGSGVVVPGTGIALQNRGAGFVLEPGHPNQVAGGKRPFHTIIPAFLMEAGAPRAAFGVMGGMMQAQGHLQMVLRVVGHGQNPQAAIDAPRWRVMQGRQVAIETTHAPEVLDGLAAMGHDLKPAVPEQTFDFGGAQAIWRLDGGYAAGSDSRKEGAAVGY